MAAFQNWFVNQIYKYCPFKDRLKVSQFKSERRDTKNKIGKIALLVAWSKRILLFELKIWFLKLASL